MSATDVISLVLITLGCILCIICVATPFWKLNDPEDTTRDTIFRHQGLWLRCISYATGNWDCDDFDKFFLGLPIMFQAVRAFSVIAMLCSVFGVVAMSMGLKSSPCAHDDKNTKRRIRLIAAVLSLIAGVLLFVGVSWYANDVRVLHDQETLRLQSNPTFTANRFIFGISLFLGWGGGALLFLAAILICCRSCFSGDTYEDEQPRYRYNPPAKRVNSGQEYI